MELGMLVTPPRAAASRWPGALVRRVGNVWGLGESVAHKQVRLLAHIERGDAGGGAVDFSFSSPRAKDDEPDPDRDPGGRLQKFPRCGASGRGSPATHHGTRL